MGMRWTIFHIKFKLFYEYSQKEKNGCWGVYRETYFSK
jgi:hypothetical protein